jgi:hypothetical protein
MDDGAAQAEEPLPQGSISRRRLLQKAAIGTGVAGAVWAAPSLLSLDAAHACGSIPCLTTTSFVWVVRYGVNVSGTPAGAANRSLPGAAIGGVTVTPTVADPTLQLALPGGDWRTRSSGEANWHLVASQQIGGTVGVSSFLKSRMGQGTAANAGASYTNTLSFSTAVRNLTFSVLDIDLLITGGAGDYRDVVVVSGTGPSGVVPFSVLAQGVAVSGAGTTTNPFVGNQNVSDTASGTPGPGNVTVCFTRPVTQVSVQHRRGTTTGVTGGSPLFGGQHIGISDLTWCAT